MLMSNVKLFRYLTGSLIVGILGVVFGVTAVQNAAATDGTRMTNQRSRAELNVQGHACHGANVFNGQPLSTYSTTESFLPEDVYDFWSSFALTEIGVYTPNGAVDVTADTPLDSIMASHVSDGMREVLGDEIADLVVEEQLNVPIHESYTPPPFDAFGTAESRVQLPWEPFAPLPNISKFGVDWNHDGPITLAEWNQANGNVQLRQYPDGSGSVHIEAHGLVPNAVYTLWQVFAVTDELPEGMAPIVGMPLGGIPNTVTADKYGRATYERLLDYDPFDLENPLMYIAFLHHWDHVLYGSWAVADLQGLPGGLVAGDQLCFPTGDYLLDVQSR